MKLFYHQHVHFSFTLMVKFDQSIEFTKISVENSLKIININVYYKVSLLILGKDDFYN